MLLQLVLPLLVERNLGSRCPGARIFTYYHSSGLRSSGKSCLCPSSDEVCLNLMCVFCGGLEKSPISREQKPLPFGASHKLVSSPAVTFLSLPGFSVEGKLDPDPSPLCGYPSSSQLTGCMPVCALRTLERRLISLKKILTFKVSFAVLWLRVKIKKKGGAGDIESVFNLWYKKKKKRLVVPYKVTWRLSSNPVCVFCLENSPQCFSISRSEHPHFPLPKSIQHMPLIYV